MEENFVRLHSAGLRQHRIIAVRRLRSQKFRQMAQNFEGHADAWSRNYGTYDEHLCKQDACIELCGVALEKRG